MKIKEVILYTNKLKEQLDFYANILEFKVVYKTSQHFSLQIGSSLLTFKFMENKGTYHFAFNIPVDKEIEALNWLKKRVEILPHQNREIADFKSWNAKSIYFYDCDSNIVEFIARRNLNIASDNDFSAESIINISEVGLPTYNLKETFGLLNQLKKIEIYDGNFEKFMAVGNEEGMFIMVNPAKKKWFPIDDDICLSDFKLKGDFNIEFLDGKINKLN